MNMQAALSLWVDGLFNVIRKDELEYEISWKYDLMMLAIITWFNT